MNDFDRAVVDEITRDRRALDEAAQALVVLIHHGAEVDGSVAEAARQLQVRLPAMLPANQEAGYLIMKVVELVADAQKT